MAFSSHREKLPRQPMLLTTIFANNIHCSSCASHIQDIVNRSHVSHAIVCTNVNILSGEIQILHEMQLPIKVVCRELSDAAFEVHSATTVDEQDRVVSELAFQQNSDGIIEEAAELVFASLQRAPGTALCHSTPMRTKRKRHVENCQACQSKEKLDVYEPVTPTKGSKESKVWAEDTMKAISEPTSTTSTVNALTRDVVKALVSPSPCPKRDSTETQAGSPRQWSTDMAITGMTCSACTNTINNALIALKNVESVQTALMTNSARVVFTANKDYEAVLRGAVEDLGYEVTATHTAPHISLSQQDKLLSQFEALQLSTSASKDAEATVHKASGSDRFQAQFSIAGMTCASCTTSITQVLGGLPFIESTNVNLLTNSAGVVMNGRDNIDTVVTAIENMGFECTLQPESVSPRKVISGTFRKSKSTTCEEAETPNSRTIQVKVDGFFCNNCPARVIDRLASAYSNSIHIEKVPTLQDPIMTLSYIPDLDHGFTVRSVIRTIDSVDDQNRFTAAIYRAPSLEERSRQVQKQERTKLLRRLLASIIFVIPTFIIGVVCMSLLPATNPTRLFFMEPVWAGQTPRAEWALFILATPVYFFVADVFHTRALKEIRALWRPKSRIPFTTRLFKFGSMNLLVSAGTTVAYVASLAVLVMSATTAPSFRSVDGMSAREDSANSSTYFDMVVFLTFFILIGRYLEAYSKAKAGDAVSMLSNLRPETAIVHENDEQLLVPTDQLEIGDTVLVRYGESPAADGVLLDHEGRFDESSLTGESKPARKRLGEKVFTGTVNLGAPVRIKVVEIGGTSMLDQIIAVVREGQVRRAPVEQIAEMITGYFVPVVTLLAILTFVIWVSLGYSGMLDSKYMQNQRGGWAFWSLEFAIAVFVVACPCGIGLAAPTALFVGGGLAAKHGILARGGGQAFQDAGKLDAIVLDKTGTLTEGGDLKVTDIEFSGRKEDEQTLMAIAHKLEMASSHPVATAIAAAALDRVQGMSELSLDVQSVEEIPGNGIQGTIISEKGLWTVRIGSSRFVSSLSPIGFNHPAIRRAVDLYEQQAKTVALMVSSFTPNESDSQEEPTSHVTAIFAVEDAIRPSAKPAVEALTKRGLEVYMVTGDNTTTAHSVASRVGIKPKNVFAGVLPTEKASTIEMLRETLQQRKTDGKVPQASPLRRVVINQGIIQDTKPPTDLESLRTSRSSRNGRFASLRSLLVDHGLTSARTDPLPEDRATCTTPAESKRVRTARIAFVGDGINDAPALSRADISISPSNGAPIALTASSFILMSGSLMAIPQLLDISTRVFQRVRLNFAWALCYNSVLLPVAAGVLFRVQEDGWRLGPVWGSLAMALSSVSVVVSSLLLRWE